MRRSVMVMSGVGLAAALALWAGSGEDPRSSMRPMARQTSAQVFSHRVQTLFWCRRRRQHRHRLRPSRHRHCRSRRLTLLVPITVTAPQKLLVGETNDLVISVGARRQRGQPQCAVRRQRAAGALGHRRGLDLERRPACTFRGRDSGGSRPRSDPQRRDRPANRHGGRHRGRGAIPCRGAGHDVGARHRRRGQGRCGAIDGHFSLRLQSADDRGHGATAGPQPCTSRAPPPRKRLPRPPNAATRAEGASASTCRT